MNYQFNHNMFTGVCTVVEDVSKSSLEMMLLTPERSMNIIWRRARCSVKDNYSRKVGRKLALEKATTDSFQLWSVIFEEGKTYWMFTNGTNRLTFMASDHSSRVYFLNYEVTE
jgi:hypothetical protein